MKFKGKKIYNSIYFHLFFVLVYFLLFFISRYPFYKFFPVPLMVAADGGAYYHLVNQIVEGKAAFGRITAGYPLFILLVHFFSGKAIALYVAQSAVALLSGLFFITRVFRHFKAFTPLACVALAMFMMQDGTLRNETASFPESLIISSLLIFLGLLLEVLYKPGKISSLLLGGIAAYIILLKSSGIFMAVIVFLLIVFLLMRKDYKTPVIVFLGFFLPLMIYAVYNKATINRFSVLSTERLDGKRKSSHLPEVPGTDAHTTRNLFYKMGRQFPAGHPVFTLHHSKNCDTLWSAYVSSRFGTLTVKDSLTGNLFAFVRFEAFNGVNLDSLIMHGEFSEAEKQWFAQHSASLDGNKVKFHPGGLDKIKVSIVGYFRNISRNHPIFYYSEVPYRYEHIFITREWSTRAVELTGGTMDNRKSLMREYFMPEPRTMDDYKAQYEAMTVHLFFKVYDILNIRFIRPFTRNIVWAYLFLLAGAVTVVIYLLHLRNEAAFFMLTLLMIYMGSNLVYALWSFSLDRYSHSTEFIPYLMVAFLPFLIKETAWKK